MPCIRKLLNQRKKGLLHIVLAESAAAIFKIKRIIKQFKKACASQIHRKFLIFEKICCTCFCFGD